MIRITAPSDWTGETRIGALALRFVEGVAEVDGPIPAGERYYMASAGYRIDTQEAPKRAPRKRTSK